MVSDEQLYLAVGIPLLFNATLVGVIIAYVNTKFQGMDKKLNARFQAIGEKFQAINTRFDDMRDLWRAELHRVEGVLDARLSHLERSR